jgi:phosphatidylserine/phosphatidylglycerophosphate/cardiolipin synthase-like enzyme
MPLLRTASWFLLCLMQLPATHPRACAQPAGPPPLEFVESVPVETSLDDPSIRNTLPVWLELIRSARRSLDMEQFYISPKPGEALDTVLAAIRDAAARGVHVRIIVDSRMYKTYPDAPRRLGQVDGIVVRVLDFGAVAGGVQHAKVFIVDGTTAFIGSQNFDWRALTHIRELGMQIRHAPTASAFSAIFETDWTLALGTEKGTLPSMSAHRPIGGPFAVPMGAGDTAYVNPTFSPRILIPDSALWDESQILALLDGAKREVFCQFLSYSTEGRDGSRYLLLDDALRRAAARGAAVRLLVSDWAKASRSEPALKNLASSVGVEVRFRVIPEWSGGYISYARVEHCKYIVVDGERFWLGTSNAEKSYFHTSRNVGIAIRNPNLGAKLRGFFLKGWEDPLSEPVRPDGVYNARRHDGD